MEELRPYQIQLEAPERSVPPVATGTFGIYAAVYKGAPCTVKSLRDASIGEEPHESLHQATTSRFDKFVSKCILYSKLRHPNIVQFIGVEYGEVPEHCLRLVMERIDTNLQSCLEAYPNIPLAMKLSVLRDVSAGLLYLHSFNPPIIHGDLTTTNILLTHDWKAKIADFGNSVDESLLSTAPGALIYMPPEAFVKPLRYDAKLDIFSFGIVSLLTGIQVKAHDCSHRSGLIQTLRTSSELDCLYQIVAQCCDHDPSKRPSSNHLNFQMEQLCNLLPYKDMVQLLYDKVIAEQKVVGIQREMNEAKKIMNAEIEKLRKEVEKVTESYKTCKLVLENYSEEKKECQEKIDLLEKENGWLKSKKSIKSKPNEYEVYIMTLEGQLSSLREDNESLKCIIATKNIQITELQNRTGSSDASSLCSSDLVEKLKTTELKLTALQESYHSVLTKLQVITNEKDIFSDDFDKEREDRSRLAGEKVHLMEQLEDTKQKLAAVHGKMHSDLMGTRKELSEAQEEIAVKVAQVKQYQKQVEAYKQQLEQSNRQTQEYRLQLDYMSQLKEESEKKLTQRTQASTKKEMDPESKKTMSLGTHAGPPPHSESTHAGLLPTACTEEDCAAGGQGIGTAHRLSLDSATNSIIQPPTSFPPSSGTDTPRPPNSDPPAQCREPVAVSASHRVPDAHAPPLADQPDLDDLPPPLVIVRPQGAVSPASHSRPYQEEYGKSADFVVPHDPNLTCPHCHIVFRKGEIQRFRQHVQECKHSR